MRFQTIWEARWIFAVLLILTAVLFRVHPWLSVIGVLLIAYTFYFFRDPDRVTPSEPDAVVAAADGVIADIGEFEESEVTKTRMKRVAIFLSVFDVHTNKAPIDGKVIHTERHVGRFLDARNPDASRLNECRTWGIQNGVTTVVVRQITGAIARRIVAWSKVGDSLRRGERFGMIRFGSRTEIYLPLSAEITAKVGDRVQGGVSIVARMR